MPRFRPPPGQLEQHAQGPLDPQAVRDVIADVFRPAHFFAAGNTALEWKHVPAETVSWDVLHGGLLDPAHTRRRRTFAAWNVYLVEQAVRSAEPLLSVKLDEAAGAAHVVRAIHCYAWEGYHAGGNVYLSRETRKWVRELVGTVRLDHFCDVDSLRDELICRVFHAVVGTSRLPLTSVEAPLPAFSFGELAYVYRPDRGAAAGQAGPLQTYRDLIPKALRADLAWLEKTKLLEACLRAVPPHDLPAATDLFTARWAEIGHASRELPALVRNLFNEVSLSPCTGLVDKALGFLAVLESRGHVPTAEAVDVLAHLLRQTGRHLTAYDLVKFHHQGANYPDALLLDAVLKAYLRRVEQRPDLFLPGPGDAADAGRAKRLRRRALRQGYLSRRRYEGHLVPDLPTSQGENARVLPPSHPRVPEAQVLNPARRDRRLFAGDPLAGHLGEQGRWALEASLYDLRDPTELRELGVALFLDRPLGAAKHPGEPDQTPLLSYEAFSRSVAGRRLQFLADELKLLGQAELEACRQMLAGGLGVRGLAVASVPPPGRPAVVSLNDAALVADDFVLLRTTARAAADFFGAFDFRPVTSRFALGGLDEAQRMLIVRDAEVPGGLAVFDAAGQKRLQLAADLQAGYESRGGVECPAGGLKVLRVWEETEAPGRLREHDLRSRPIVVPPRGWWSAAVEGTC